MAFLDCDIGSSQPLAPKTGGKDRKRRLTAKTGNEDWFASKI
jgi:hypothetical protein